MAVKQAIDEAPPAACRADMKKRTHLCVLLVVEKIFRAAARKNRKLQQAAIALIKMPQASISRIKAYGLPAGRAQTAENLIGP